MRIGGGTILPSGSINTSYTPRWVVPSKHLPYPLEIPDGTLVKVLPIAGPIWSGNIGIVLKETTNFGVMPITYQTYLISTGNTEIILPKYALDVISFPPDYESDD